MKPSLRFEVFKRDNFTCRYCGRASPEAILEADHVIPRAEGGPDEIENLVTSCSQCNIGKGARLLTSVPGDADLHERTVLIAEQERQVSEFRYWQERQREREEADIDRLASLWPWKTNKKPWQRTSVRTFLRKLGFVSVLEMVEYIVEHDDIKRADQGWMIFCKMCWNRVRRAEGGE